MSRFFGLAAALAVLVLAGAGAGAWTTPADVTNLSDYECGPRTGRDAANRIHLVWYGGAPDSTAWRIYYQVYDGAGWTSPVSISGANASYPDIAVDGADNLHAVWHAGGNPEEIYYRKCTGGVWGATVNLSNTAGARSLSPRIAVDPTANDMLVVWHEDKQTNTNWDVIGKRYVGGAWGSLENVSADSTLSRCADVVRDALGNYHVAWEDTDTNHVYYRKRDAGGSWAATTAIDTNSGRSFGVALAVDASNGVHAVWHDNNTANDDWDITYRYRSGSSWGSVVNISNNPGVTDCGAGMDVDSNGNVFVAWHDYNSIYYAEKRNGSWRPWYVISSGTNQVSPCVTTDGNSRTHLTWQSRMPGSWDVMWCRQDLDLAPPATPLNFAAAASMGKVYLNWKNPSEIDFKGTVVRCSSSGYPASPSDGSAVCDMAATPGSTRSFVHQPVTNGVTYYYSAFSYDAVPNYSTAAHATATPTVMSIATAKRDVQDGQPVDLYSKVVTANFVTSDGCIYVQEPDGVSGIRAETTDSSFQAGDIVDVSGTIVTRALNGHPSERVLSGAKVTRLSAGLAPQPLAMNCRSVGGGSFGSLVPGVKNGAGLNNIGLFVRISGKVTYVAGTYVYVDDGSGIENLYGLWTQKVGVMVRCPSAPGVVEGNSVTVSGIVEGSIPNNVDWTTNRAYIHACGSNDIVIR